MAQENLRSVGTLISDSYKSYKENIGKYSTLSLWLIIPILALTIFAKVIIVASILDIIVILAGLFVSITLYSMIVGGGKPSISEAWQKGRGKFWIYIWTAIAVATVTLGGFFLLLIPGLIFSVWFNFTNFAIFEDNVGGSSALWRSRLLVRGRWWPVFGRIIVYGLLVGLIGALFTWLDTATGTIAFSTLYSILMAFLLPLFTLYLYNIYKDLKATRPEEKAVPVVTSTKIWMAIIGVWGVLSLIVSFGLLVALVVKAL